MFDTGAETHIAKSIDDFNTGIYTPVTLPLINTAGKQVKPPSFGKRTIIYTIDTKGKIYTLNLNKVQYLLDCNINIFRAWKLLKGVDI